MYRAIVELEHGSTPSAWTAASKAVETAQRFGLSGYHGVAPGRDLELLWVTRQQPTSS